MPYDRLFAENDGSMTLFAGSGNDVAFGGALDDNMRGESGNDTLSGGFGDDRLDGGSGDDRLLGDIGSAHLIGGAGNDFLQSGQANAGDSSVLTGGDGSDVFNYGMHGDLEAADSPRNVFIAVNDLISDFSDGDRLDISWQQSFSVDGSRDSYDFSFADLDSNADGFVTGTDDAVSLQAASFMGQTADSLVIDLEIFTPSTEVVHHSGDGSPPVSSTGQTWGSGTITLFGVTSLAPGDFVT
jgi:Ca2+-binding RTX toxin-like protein